MDEKEAQAIRERVQGLENLVRSLQKTISDIGRASLDIPHAVGPYAASSPTADGTIPMVVNGQRVNVLVDKV